MKKQLISNITIGAVLSFLSFSSCLIPTEENICHEVSLTEALFKKLGKAAKLPPHLQKLRNIKETDNPVVMIAKLKE